MIACFVAQITIHDEKQYRKYPAACERVFINFNWEYLAGACCDSLGAWKSRGIGRQNLRWSFYNLFKMSIMAGGGCHAEIAR